MDDDSEKAPTRPISASYNRWHGSRPNSSPSETQRAFIDTARQMRQSEQKKYNPHSPVAGITIPPPQPSYDVQQMAEQAREVKAASQALYYREKHKVEPATVRLADGTIVDPLLDLEVVRLEAQ